MIAKFFVRSTNTDRHNIHNMTIINLKVNNVKYNSNSEQFEI